MDLSRRFAAGELSELFGGAALEHDTRVRRFGFPRGGAPGDRGRTRGRARRQRGLHTRRERRAREPRHPARGNTCCCAPGRAHGCRRTRCWWCTRCGGSCSIPRSPATSTGAGWSAPRRPPPTVPRHTSSSPSSTRDTRSGIRLTIQPTRAACTAACAQAGVRSRPFPALLRFAATGRGEAARRRQAGQQQLGGGGHPHALGRGADRQRHAPGPGCAGGLVSGAPARHGRVRHRRHRCDPARHAGRGCRIQRPRRVGLHQQLRRFRRRALRKVREPRLRRAPRAASRCAVPRPCRSNTATWASAWCWMGRPTRMT